MKSNLAVIDGRLPLDGIALDAHCGSLTSHDLPSVMTPVVHTSVGDAATMLAAAAAAPAIVTGEQAETIVWELAQIARHLGELTAAARHRWAAWGTVTPHLQQAQALADDVARCLTHAADIYAFNTSVGAGSTRR